MSFLVVLLTSCTTTSELSQREDLRKSLSKLIDYEVTENDLRLLEQADRLKLAFLKLTHSKFDKANEISEEILNKPGLSVAIYKYAFKAYTISLILNDSVFPKKNNILKNFDFTVFQNMQCKKLCDTPGWKTLVQNDSFIFSPHGYNDIVLSEDIFSIIKHEKPILSIDPIFLGKRKVNYQPVTMHNSFEYGSNENILKELDEKMALSFFLHGEFTKSIDIFYKLAIHSNDISFKSFCYYWIGRAYSAQNNEIEAKKFYVLSGTENPLGLYDALSGQMLKSISGRASTNELSPFLYHWQEEKNKWIKFHYIKMHNPEVMNSLKYAILSISKMKLDYNINDLDNFQRHFKQTSAIEKLIITDEINWLTRNWEKQFNLTTKQERPDLVGNNITWLNYIVGNYLQAILLISKIKNTLDPLYDNNNFLYFLFYPQFYKDQVIEANKKCHVDPDLMYAIFRQEGFFQQTDISNNEAVKKVCDVKNILTKYKNNIVNTLSAYRAGTAITDIWLNENVKINDDPIFMEYIPDEKIKEFVQGVMKNYYNIKWIYYNKN